MKNISVLFIVVFVFLAVVIFCAIYFFKYSKKFINPLSLKEFSCPGLTGFTFKYPLLKDFNSSVVMHDEGKQNCIVLFKGNRLPSDLYIQMRVEIIYYDIVPDISAPNIKTNPMQVKYDGLPKSDPKQQTLDLSRQFYGPDFLVKVSLSDITGRSSFNMDLLWRSLIDSFQFTPK